MKKLAFLLSMSFISSCTIFNIHNLVNKNKWRNKVLPEPARALVIFEPLFLEEYGEDAKFFYDYFEDTTKVSQLKVIFLDYLEQKNIFASDIDYESIIRIEEIELIERTHWESVSHTNEEEEIFLGDAVAYDVDIEIRGSVQKTTSQIKTPLEDTFSFTSNPRPGVFDKSTIVHSNYFINMHTVFSKMFNKLSYQAYKAHLR